MNVKWSTLLCFLTLASTVLGQNLESDRQALVALYNSTNGANWINKDNWIVPGTVGDNPCGWYGVTCSGSRVTELKLDCNQLTGTLPPEIGNLSALKVLNLNGSGFIDNSFTITGLIGGVIPTEIGQLTNLEQLDLGVNLFTGTIPGSLGNLVNLTYLDISFMSQDYGFTVFGTLTGTLPSSLGNLTALKYLNISGQDLYGNLPESFGNLQNIETLYLGTNRLSGPIPSGYGRLPKLKLLDLHYNPRFRDSEYGGLNGTIPDFSGLPADAQVYLGGNSFTFNGMESNISRLASYGNQNLIELESAIPLVLSNGGPGQHWVNAGGTMANNTYYWYKNNRLIETKVGDNSFYSNDLGTYHAEVTNSIAPQLRLKTTSYTVNSMPVTLLSFDGKSGVDGNVLRWKTVSETNNAGFEVERGVDGKIFEKMGFVDGGGNSQGIKEYSFTDPQPYGITYYRLKQIDFDGKSELSTIISVKNSQKALAVFPNPSADWLSVKNMEKEQEVFVRNANGTLVIRQVVGPNKPLITEKLSNGVYTLSMGTESRKFVVQK